MIGQTRIRDYLIGLVDANTLPKFIILVGEPGSGRKTLTKFLAYKMGVNLYVCDGGVGAVRKMISDANKFSVPVLYMIPDADKLSVSAKNALLKITEEPPKNAYFVMTLTSTANTLNTIASRGVVYKMDPYSAEELLSYADALRSYSLTTQEKEIIESVCSTPGEVSILLDAGVLDFYEYVEKVVDNIATVSGTNAFKIADKIALKEADKDKYNLQLFWKTFLQICTTRLLENLPMYHKAIRITSKCLADLSISSINRSMLFDYWILEIRKEWIWIQEH